MIPHIVFLGLPWVGKGTQAKLLSGQTGLPHISTGEIFRGNRENPTPTQRMIHQLIDQGEYVPDDLAIQVLRERLSQKDCRDGAILDGFPRTKPQVPALDEMLRDLGGQVSAVVHLTASVDVLEQRVVGRSSCPACEKVYHETFIQPRRPGFCDHDGTALVHRPDDTIVNVAKRVKTYLKETAPLAGIYRMQGKLLTVDGMQPYLDVNIAVRTALKTLGL